ncbi:hypothetical protein EWB00_005894 [Schistosoma japonicum]|uniref:Uncharacterized protein n=1 Tax=Schistosoma japonicum TaxID=6182 RepID=A0A4Z2D0A1_SCHJA|nr:hypothetical protein EWB00_005894 [Schistosoma japonicum]
MFHIPDDRNLILLYSTGSSYYSNVGNSGMLVIYTMITLQHSLTPNLLIPISSQLQDTKHMSQVTVTDKIQSQDCQTISTQLCTW